MARAIETDWGEELPDIRDALAEVKAGSDAKGRETTKRHPAEKFDPVPHTAEDDARLFANSRFKEVYDALEEEYTAILALLSAAKKSNKKTA